MEPSEPGDAWLVLVTAPDSHTAEALARELVADRLVACVNVLPGITSYFRWEGRVEAEQEVLMVIKTTAERAGALETRIHERHPYDVPEFVALRAAQVAGPYLGWLRAAVALEAAPATDAATDEREARGE